MKGILFHDLMFTRVAGGHKNMTRRLVGEEINDNPEEWRAPLFPVVSKGGKYVFYFTNKKTGVIEEMHPRYHPGEIVFLKESIRVGTDVPSLPSHGEGQKAVYRNDADEKERGRHRWSNRLFASERTARYFIKIIKVGVERIQSISEEDCVREGVEFNTEKQLYRNYLRKDAVVFDSPSAYDSFYSLWVLLQGEKNWMRNEWAWKYEFCLTTEKLKNK